MLFGVAVGENGRNKAKQEERQRKQEASRRRKEIGNKLGTRDGYGNETLMPVAEVVGHELARTFVTGEMSVNDTLFTASVGVKADEQRVRNHCECTSQARKR